MAVTLGVLGALVPGARPASAAPQSITTAVIGTGGGPFTPFAGTALGPDFIGGRWTALIQEPLPNPQMPCAGSWSGWFNLVDLQGNRLTGSLGGPICADIQMTVTGGTGTYAGATGSGTLKNEIQTTPAGFVQAGLVQLTVDSGGSPPPPPAPEPFQGAAVLTDLAGTGLHMTGPVVGLIFVGQITIDLSPPDPAVDPCLGYSQQGTFVLDDGAGNRLAGTAEANPFGLPAISIDSCQRDQPFIVGRRIIALHGQSGTGRFAGSNLQGSLVTWGVPQVQAGLLSLNF